jgi:hypothetical protein
MYLPLWAWDFSKGARSTTNSGHGPPKKGVCFGAKKNNQLVFNNARDHHINVGSNNYEQS